MTFGEIDLDLRLIQAQMDGRLVIIAGAGVSMGKPTNLPGFSDLVKRLAAPFGLTQGKNEEPDRFLGRLEAMNPNLKLAIAKELSPATDDKTKAVTHPPNELHRLSLQLFTPGACRLVTTNQDMVFRTASGELGLDLKLYPAPALPLGNDFSGIVELHGAIDDPRRMVFSDVDYGRAYQVDGWANRFLIKLFETYTVLFVGYSHNDPPVRYLARGMSQSKALPPRFALVEGSNFAATKDHWESIGVVAIPYPQRNPSDHGALAASAIQVIMVLSPPSLAVGASVLEWISVRTKH